jgi:tetratricopeptide (TPR) repeat protein
MPSQPLAARRAVIIAALALVLGAAIHPLSAQEKAAEPAPVPAPAAADLELQLRVGDSLLVEGRAAEAVTIFEDLTTKAPSHAGGWLMLARALSAAGRPADARDAAVHAVRELEKDSPGLRKAFGPATFYETLGTLQLATTQLEEAEAAFRKATAEAPDTARLERQLGSVLLREGEDAEAATWLEKAIAHEKDDVASLVDLGSARLRLEDLPAAETAFRRAIELSPSSAEAHYGLASALRVRGDEAGQAAELAEFEKLEAARKERADKELALRGAFLDATKAIREGHLPEATKALESYLADPFVVKEHFQLVEAWIDLARVRGRTGEVASAREAYESAIAAEPTSSVARRELGELLTAHGLVDEAMPLFVEAAALSPMDHAAHRALATGFAVLGRLDDAAREAAKASLLDPTDSGARQLTVDVFWAAGKQEQARALAASGGVQLPAGAAPAPAALPSLAGTRRGPKGLQAPAATPASGSAK